MSNGGAPESRKANPLSSNLQLRIASALVLGAIVLALAWFGGMPFRILAAVIAAFVFHEWISIAGARTGRGADMIGRALLVIVLAGLIAGLGALACFALLAAALVLRFAIELIGRSGHWSSVGLAYAAVPGICIAFLRGSDSMGLKAILFLFVVVWATDILAYFAGRAIGGPKLAPAISPGKTWSGALGGAVGGVAGGLAFAFAAGSLQPLTVMALVALVLSIVSQAGDLFESAVKRRCGVKDSGTLIPGHGGVMDRVDGLVAAAVLFYLMGALLSQADTPAHGFFA